MRFQFLGTGGSAPVPGRPTVGVYLPDHGLLLDIGSNAFPLRQLHGEGPLHVLMSHYHVDHSAGLFTLAAGLFHGRAQPEITVYGPEWGDRFRGCAGPESPLFPIEFPFPIREAPDRFEVAGVEVSARPVPHNGPVLAYRLRFPDGRSLAYVTDTTAPGDYADFVRGVEVLIHECTFSRRNAEWSIPSRHSAPDGVAALASAAEVGELYLVHLSALEDRLTVLEEVRAGFPRTVLPIEGLEYPRPQGSPTPVNPRAAIFPGSFDPLTVSHLDIIESCTRTFDEVHVVVARNPAKDAYALFSPTERVELIRRCVPASVTVAEWEGLTVAYAERVQAGCLVRGLGRAEDYFGEVRLWKTNALLAPEIQTVWVPPRAEHLDVASSMIKEASLFGGWEGVRHLVPEPIREEVAARIAERQHA